MAEPRRILTIACSGRALAATLDPAPGRVGLVMVSGGREIRAGAHAGMAQLAARIAGAGFPVLRFDPPGVGDSEGVDTGWRGRGPALHAAIAALRAAAPCVGHVALFGICDAATLIATEGPDDMTWLLANPWLRERDDAVGPAPAAIRAHYRQRLRRPGRLVADLARGRIALHKALAGGRAALRHERAGTLASTMARRLTMHGGDARILLARDDMTARSFTAAWAGADFAAVRGHVPLESVPSASHSFADPAADAWLFDQILSALSTAAGRMPD